jgi:pimeloyl-ACP methyl ester carboxylesterase
VAERSRFRGLAIGVGITAATAAAALAAQRTAVRRLRGRPDPEARDDLTVLPPEDLGPVRSFDGTELHVRAAGPRDAPVLLFLHGFSLDMTTWHYQWRALSDRYRCVLMDHRAHGRSGRPASGDFSLMAMGKDVAAVLRVATGDGPVVLVGHSMGGMAILTLVQQFPEEFARRVAGVVFADTAASDVLRELFGGLGARLGWAFRQVGTRYSTRPDLAERLQKRVRKFGADFTFLVGWATNFGPGASPSHVEHVSRISADAPVEVWVHTLRDITEMDLREVLEHITVPALVVVGDRDLITPKTSAQALRAALPDATAVVITGAGHVSMLERHRVFNEVLERFLTKVSAPSRAAASRA